MLLGRVLCGTWNLALRKDVLLQVSEWLRNMKTHLEAEANRGGAESAEGDGDPGSPPPLSVSPNMIVFGFQEWTKPFRCKHPR
jgi:hypothetical protein